MKLNDEIEVVTFDDMKEEWPDVYAFKYTNTREDFKECLRLANERFNEHGYTLIGFAIGMFSAKRVN